MVIQQERNPGSLAPVINALGTDDFERETLRVLHDMVGAEHYSVYRIRNGKAEFLGGGSVRGRHAINDASKHHRWPPRSYVELHQANEVARSSPSAIVLHDEVKDIADPALHSALQHFQIGDRVMVCGTSVDDLYALALLRSRGSGQFEDDALKDLAASADVLIAVCAKHASLHWDRGRTLASFKSVDVIESHIRAGDWGLPERELQVSARILFGISAYGIALDLGLGEETIATYRKRLYARLQIAGRHELLQRYLSLL
ncbi:MAG: helix-turn-helix transcriptional regulator [Novosphingobium sp.]